MVCDLRIKNCMGFGPITSTDTPPIAYTSLYIYSMIYYSINVRYRDNVYSVSRWIESLNFPYSNTFNLLSSSLTELHSSSIL